MSRLGSEGGLTWKSKLKLADKFYGEGYYYDAAHYYQEVLDETDDVDVAYKLAESYYNSRDYKNAEMHYEQVKLQNLVQYPFSQYKYALTLKMNGDYKAAKLEFEKFKNSYRGENSKNHKILADNEIKGCDYAIEAIKKPLEVKIEHLGKAVNAAYTEAAPFPVGDSLLLYASLRTDTIIIAEDGVYKGAKFRLYQSKKDNGKWNTGELLPEIVNVSNADVANGAFSPDLKKFFFTRCEENDEGKLLCSIYQSDYENGNWENPVKLDELINMPGFTSTHPTVAPYKKGAHILYFASDMPGSIGGLDLWYVITSKQGDFAVRKTPKNLGKKINTLNDELTPYFDSKTNILYFSSNGHPGIGGYDVFMTEGNLRKWSDPQNIGYPLNSRVDDMYFVSDRKGGYFVSNRPGVIALKSETCCDDIFRFDWHKVLNFAVDGFAYDADDSTQTILEEVKIKLNLIDKGWEEVLIDEVTTVKDLLFFFTLNQNKLYKISAAKSGYFSNSAMVSTLDLEESDTLHVKLPLKKLELNKAIVLKDIYYDFDKATLRPASDKTLDLLVSILNENPEIIVELSAHTDSKGDDLYNEKLSQRRAESVVKFLRKEGISKKRLIAKGYGESQPIALNTNPDGSDNPEGRQLNRRTELKVVGTLDIDIIKEKAKIEDAMEDAEEE
ncbi:MAG: OmpA family protein [Bacteroidota bacterium]